MKKGFYLLLVLTIFSFSSCHKNEELGVTLDDRFYKILSFTSQNTIDVNNDGQSNTDVLVQLTNYANYPYDFEILVKRELTLYNFYIPAQSIIYDSNNAAYVNFDREIYIKSLEDNSDYIENYIIDNDNKIISFRKISETKYKLIFQKKYYDFNTMQDVNGEFTIIYELND